MANKILGNDFKTTISIPFKNNRTTRRITNNKGG